MTATPNHALQRTRSAVTAPAADHHRLSTHRQVPRRSGVSLSLGSFGDSSRLMKSAISILSVLAFTAMALLTTTAFGQPQNFGPPPQATLRADGSVVVKPTESIVLKFDTQGGKIANITTLPWDTKETDSIIRIAIKREGGVSTKLGPTSPINDVLIVWSSASKPLSARCEYTTLAASKPDRARLYDKDGKIEKAFRWGVAQVVVSEIQFK
jgi:hypothetical protein